MSTTGKIRLTFIISAPPEHVAEGERIFASHAPWMRQTHDRSGDTALLSYDVSSGPEMSNPMDPSSEPTGNTCFILNEVYETPAGVADHFEKAGSWQDFPALLAWLENCKVTGITGAPISASLW